MELQDLFKSHTVCRFYQWVFRILGLVPIIGLITGPILAFIVLVHAKFLGHDDMADVRKDVEKQKKALWERVEKERNPKQFDILRGSAKK